MTVDDPPDGELWARAAGGSGTAFGMLFDRHARAVHNHCFRLTASWSAADNVFSRIDDALNSGGSW